MSTAGMLSQFLTDIGAAALSPAVDLPATPETTPPFAALHDRLTEEITSINDQTRQLLEDNWSNFQEQVADGKELLVRMEEEETELTELEGELAGDRAFLPSLVGRLTAHSKLAQTNSLATHTLTLITSLLALHTTISTVSNHTTAGSLPLAVASLRELQSALTRGAEPWIESTDAWNALRRWGADEQLRLEGSVAGALDGCFEFSPTTSTAGTTLTLRSSIAAAPRGEELSVPVLLQALEDVFVMGGAGKKVDAQLARVSRQLLKYFVVPFLETNGRPNDDGKLEIVYAEERGAWTATIRPRSTESEGEAPDEDPLKEIATLLTFFATHTHLFPPSPYAANFTANLTPTIQALVISSHLAPSLPATIDLISPYLSTLSAASTFESSFLSTSGYFAFLPKESHGQMREEGKVIQSWVERVDKHWAGKVGDAALEKLRQEIVKGDWKGEMMDVEVEIEGEGGRTKMVKEQMLVSVRSKELVRVADEVLDKAIAVGSPDFPHPTFATASSLLLRTFISILSLYRAIVPIQHATALSTVPSIGVQFANDTDWIGEAVEAVWRKSKSGQSSELDLDVEQALKMTKKMGKDWRERQISTQRESLMESLDVANRFLYTGDDARFAACERALAQVIMTLQRLVKVWKPVMNPTAFYSTLGNLVNDVLQRVLDEIMEQIDISEEESIRLNKLCKQLHDLEGLFEGDVTSIGIEVPVWFKFVFLSELLEASMADILFLFDDGHLVDFEPEAIAKLVRALFSDSPLRNRNLEHILKGHPTVVPDNDTEDGSRAPSPTPRHVAPPPPPRTPSPPPALAPTTRSGRQPLGTRIVNAKPSTPSPPPTPPRRSPSPPPQAALPVEAPSPAVVGTPEIDPELNASFDDFHADDDWGFSAEASPSPAAEPSALPSPPPATNKAVVSPPPPPEATLVASPPPSKPLSPPVAAPRSLASPPASAALAVPIAASLAAVASTTRNMAASFGSSNGAGEAADDAWDLDWEEETSAVGSLPKEEEIVAPLSELEPESVQEVEVAAQPEHLESGVEEQGEEAWGLGEEEQEEQEQEQEHPAAASPIDAPFEFDEDPSPIAEPQEEEVVEEIPIASPPVDDAPLSPPVDEAPLLPSVDEAIISPLSAEAALSPPVVESRDLPEQEEVVSAPQEDVEDASAREATVEEVLEPSIPQQPVPFFEEEVTAPEPIAAEEPLPTAVEEVKSTPFDAPVAQDDTAASLFLGSPPSMLDKLGASPFGDDSNSSSFFNNIGPGPVDEPRETLEQPSIESPVERPYSPPLVAFESDSQALVTEQLEVEPQPEEEEAVVEQPEQEKDILADEVEEQAVEESAPESPALPREEALADELISSPIVHAQHTAVIVHEEPVSEQPAEEQPVEGESGWDLGAEDESTSEVDQEPSSVPVDAVVEHIDHVEDGPIAIDQEEERIAEPSQLIEDVAQEAPRSPSPPPRSPWPIHRVPSPPIEEPLEQLDQELEEDPIVAVGLPGAEDQHIAVEEVVSSAADPIFTEETINDAASPSEEQAPTSAILDSATSFEEPQPTHTPLEEPNAAESPAVAFDERAFSPSAGLGSSPEMLEHLSSPITSPELVDNIPLPEDEPTPVAEESYPAVEEAQVEEPVEVDESVPAVEEPIEHVEVAESTPVVEPVKAEEQQESSIPEHFDEEALVEEPSREEPSREAGEMEVEEDGGWGLGAEEEGQMKEGEVEETEHFEQAPPATEGLEERTTQQLLMEALVHSPPQVRAASPSPIPTPPSPLLSPVLDDGPIPTPLQQATPPSLPTPSTAIDVATPAQELHLDEDPFVRAEIAEPLTPGGHDSPALVPDEKQELVKEEEVVQPEPEVEAEPVVEAEVEQEIEEDTAGGEGEEDDGWGLGDELEGLEEAGEDEPLPPIAYTPVSPPRPLPYALPISPPPMPRPAPPPAASATTYGRLATPTKTSAPPPRVPHFFSPPKVVAPSPPTEEEAEDDGWGFDEEDSNGLGYMEDDGPANENEELGQDLYSPPSSHVPLSPPKRNGHVAKKESVDDDGWGF